MKNETRVEATNKIDTTIETLNIVFSNPLLVWNAELKLSPPPKAPPRLALVLCIRIRTVRITAKIICIYGKTEEIPFIGCILA